MTLSLKPRPRPNELREFRYTRDDYAALMRAGLFESARIELIRGRLIEMPAMSDDHGSSVMKCGRVLRRLFGEDCFTVRMSLPFIAADNSEPEPDLCVAIGPAETIKTHPSACLLIVEVSRATLTFDRIDKRDVYAEAGVPEYWIVNLVDRVIEIYRQPDMAEGGCQRYSPPIIRRPGERFDLQNQTTSPRIDPHELLPDIS